MSTYKGVMYHGTDKNVLRMGEQERKRMLELCNEMAEYAYIRVSTRDQNVDRQLAALEPYKLPAKLNVSHNTFLKWARE